MKQNNKELNELEQQVNVYNKALNEKSPIKYNSYIETMALAGTTASLGVLYHFDNSIATIGTAIIIYTFAFLPDIYQHISQKNKIKKELNIASKLYNDTNISDFKTSELQKRADKNLANKNKEHAVAFLREIKEYNLRDEDMIIKKIKHNQVLSDSNKNIVLNELIDAGFLPTVATTLPKLVKKHVK